MKKREVLKIIMLSLGLALIVYGAYAAAVALRPFDTELFIWGILGVASGVFATWMYFTKP